MAVVTAFREPEAQGRERAHASAADLQAETERRLRRKMRVRPRLAAVAPPVVGTPAPATTGVAVRPAAPGIPA